VTGNLGQPSAALRLPNDSPTWSAWPWPPSPSRTCSPPAPSSPSWCPGAARSAAGCYWVWRALAAVGVTFDDSSWQVEVSRSMA